MTLRWLAIAVFAAAASPAAFAGEEKPAFPVRVDLEKFETHYYLDVPAAYFAEENAGKAWPLILALHGAGDTAKNFVTGFWPLQRKGYLICAVKSPGMAWSGNEDALVIAAMEDVKAKYRIDPRRISLAGFSSGAFFGMPLAFRRPELFDALVAMGGGAYAGVRGRARALHVYLLAGEDDPVKTTLERAAEQLQKKGVDATWREVPGIGHVWPPEEEIHTIVKWFHGFSPEALEIKRLEQLLERARAGLQRATLESVIEDLREIAESRIECEAVNGAKAELETLEAEANAEIERAHALSREGKTAEARSVLLRVARRYRGLAAADDAETLADMLR